MSKHRPILIFIFFLAMTCAVPRMAKAQCSICTRTAQQLGERPARALNRGIIYLAFAPLAIFGFLGYKWWKNEQHDESKVS